MYRLRYGCGSENVPSPTLVPFAHMVPLKILVVDDDALSRDLLALLLTREGHSVEVVESGEAALAHLANGSPDLVLADLQMPGISGSTLAHKLRQTNCPARLLAMSGSQPQDEALGGFDGFLLKPFAMDEVAAAMQSSSHTSKDMEPHAADVLDFKTYEKLQASMGPGKLDQLYDLCLSDVRKRVATMRTAAAEGDDATYRREAHAIKGGCGLVGAMELQTIAASGENLGIVANHVATLDEILVASERLERMLVANKQSIASRNEPVRSHA
jgi:CheY-like chemotaxis protein/HPt (histidine-containing phosphotransfer) domain-containing protein